LQEDSTQLQAIVNQIMHNAQQDPHLQDMVVAVSAATIMAKPIHKLWQWISNSHPQPHACSLQGCSTVGKVMHQGHLPILHKKATITENKLHSKEPITTTLIILFASVWVLVYCCLQWG